MSVYACFVYKIHYPTTDIDSLNSHHSLPDQNDIQNEDLESIKYRKTEAKKYNLRSVQKRNIIIGVGQAYVLITLLVLLAVKKKVMIFKISFSIFY